MFLHHLAVKLGKTVQELDGLSRKALDHWRAFRIMNPFGDWEHEGMSIAAYKAKQTQVVDGAGRVWETDPDRAAMALLATLGVADGE